MQAADILRECESWEDFQQRLSVLTEKEKGDAFELLVKFVLQIHPLYATKLEKVWLQSEVEFTIREHLGVPLKDYGIDIVARTFGGDSQVGTVAIPSAGRRTIVVEGILRRKNSKFATASRE